MRDEDLEPLLQPFPDDGRSPDDKFADQLGIYVDNVRRLAGEIAGDRDRSAPGIRWWSHLDARRRILLGDQLLECVGSIETNLVEARLHFLEGREAWDRITTFALGLVIANGHPKLPPYRNGKAHLPDALARLHTVGFFRAIGSAFDCLGSAVVGVLGLNTPLLTADLGKALRAIAKRRGRSRSPQEDLWLAFLDHFDELENQSGPPGWRQWATDMRNMYVHRARRMHAGAYEPSRVEVEGMPKVRPVFQLPRDPACSDMEMFTHPSYSVPDCCLDESAETTVARVREVRPS